MVELEEVLELLEEEPSFAAKVFFTILDGLRGNGINNRLQNFDFFSSHRWVSILKSCLDLLEAVVHAESRFIPSVAGHHFGRRDVVAVDLDQPLELGHDIMLFLG